MSHWDRLPVELQHLICAHMFAMKIQKVARAKKFTFAQKPMWKPLRRLLLTQITPFDFDVLCRCAMIRKEWNQEPESWIHSMETSDLLPFIVEEVCHGLWMM